MFNVASQRQFVFLNSPGILFHLSNVVVHSGFELESSVNFMGHVYTVFGVIYQKGESYDHYIIRFRRNNTVYAYDGMRNSESTYCLCTPIVGKDGENLFPTQIPHKKNGLGPIRMLGFMFKKQD